MKRMWYCAGLLAFLAIGTGARAQTSLEVIQDDLRAAKEQHDSADSQTMTTFLSALDNASGSPAAALDLYQRAGGTLPSSTPVQSHYDYETPTEKAQREARDAQVMQAEGELLQVHCGLMRNAARLMLTPNAPGVQTDWINWLQTVAPLYPQLVPPAPPSQPAPGDETEHHHHKDDDGTTTASPTNSPPVAPPSPVAVLKKVTMSDSLISSYLGFRGWGESEQGKWAVSDLPRLYHDLVLQPLRQPVNPAVINAWNVYIAMRQTDETDQGKWTQDEQPEFDFERASDDFDLQPNMDKLAALDDIIKANPTSSHLDEWITRMQGMIATYQRGGTNHSPLPAATPGTPSSDATGAVPTATPGATSSEAAGLTPTATPGADDIIRATPVSGATPGTTSSEVAGPLPTATPGATSVTTGGPLPAATPGVSSSVAPGMTPTATPGTPSAGGGAPLPTASPGTPSSAAPGPIPTATPGTPSSGTTVAPTGTP